MDTNRPLFTFIMGVKDPGSEFIDAIESIKNQTFSNWDMILIDDGSTEGCSDFICQTVRDIPKIKLFKRENKGLTQTLIEACDLADGHYLVRQDADDMSALDRLEKMSLAIEKHAPDVIFMRTQLFGNYVNHKLSPSKADMSGVNFSLLKFGNIFVHGSVCFKREILSSITYSSHYSFAQDFDFFLKIFQAKLRIVMINRVGYFLRISSKSITRSKRSEQNECAKKIAEYYFGSSSCLIPIASWPRKGFLKIKKRLWYLKSFFQRTGQLKILDT